MPHASLAAPFPAPAQARPEHARGGTRTHTSSRTAVFKTAASAYSATRACKRIVARSRGAPLPLAASQLSRPGGVQLGGTGRLRVEASAVNQAGVAGLHGRSPLLRLQSDERLIALVRRGHPRAFEARVARYQSRLLAFCRHMLSSKEDAEDVLQEV